MIDLFIIFTKAGLVLFSHELTKVKNDPINALVKNVLLVEKKGERMFSFGSQAIRWVIRNDLGLVFAAVYMRILSPIYVGDLLNRVSEDFVNQFGGVLNDTCGKLDYDAQYKKILKDVQPSALKPEHKSGSKTSTPSAKVKNTSNNDSETKEGGSEASQSDADNEAPPSPVRRVGGGRRRQMASPAAFKPKNKTGSSKKQSKKSNSEPSTEELDLDRSKKSEDQVASDENEFRAAAHHLPSPGEESEIIADEKTDSTKSWSDVTTSAIGGFFKGLTGNKVLTKEDLEAPLAAMHEALVKKNVASEVAKALCESVEQNLEGQKLASFTRVSTVVQEAFEKALLRVLTPKSSTDVLREALAAKEAGKVYSICFIGVNGVGKSTSLAKVCYYLKQQGLSVMLIACDTFRSGAVEQLKVHARAMDVPVFERGYVKDPASVAIDGIKHAEQKGFDVVLIDTAGRMQNNEPLMRALAKLVDKNSPDLVLFVGEALVGNDGCDQLQLFNQALKDYSTVQTPRLIDGIVLTKFDTIDDKVGAAVSMVHKTGQPILFVGTGQKYTNLNKLNVKKVLNALLS